MMESNWRLTPLANPPYSIDVFNCSPLFAILSWQYINLKSNLAELREIPCVKPSEEQAGRGFCDQCLSEADDVAFEANRVLSATDPIVRSEGIRRSRTQIQGGLLLLTFLGRLYRPET